ncbi:39S ribosomal protein L32, mitochondrial-like [Dreissena polymorpha]|nr:39S ribosomal protein L32, mitochondrial-like [Dreissena polymorpha]XP_052255366.1 39S ribosomal protein L32, mitochondrial-like [Dreissena polymorpha]
MTLTSKLRLFVNNINSIILKISGTHQTPGLPALCVVECPSLRDEKYSSPSDILASIFEPIMRWVNPRNRRTVERRLTRKNLLPQMKDARPKKNIIICLHCGRPHEIQTLCGYCYSKVRVETKKLQEQNKMIKDQLNKFKTEVAFLYRGENKNDVKDHKKKYFVEVDRERPEWFAKELMVKYKGES